MNKWDEFCFLRANTPSRLGWWTMVLLLAFIATVTTWYCLRGG